MAAPTTYEDSAGRLRCASTGNEVTKCRCKAHKPRQKKLTETKESAPPPPPRQRVCTWIRIDFDDDFPTPGETVELTNYETGEDFIVEILAVHEVKWNRTSSGGLMGVKIKVTYEIVEITKPGRPVLKLVK